MMDQLPEIEVVTDDALQRGQDQDVAFPWFALPAAVSGFLVGVAVTLAIGALR